MSREPLITIIVHISVDEINLFFFLFSATPPPSPVQAVVSRSSCVGRSYVANPNLFS